ncbi:MAG: phenylacetate--CoA ligase family protein [Myxococcota bacterium]
MALLAPARLSSLEVALFARYLIATVRAERGGQGAVRALQRQRLSRVIAAARKTHLYAAALQEHPGADPEAQLAALPPTSKGAFLARLEDTLAEPRTHRAELEAWVRAPERAGQLLRDRYVVAMTSGTTGQVGIFLNDLDSWAATRAITFARIFRNDLQVRSLVTRLRPERFRMAFVVASGGHYMTSLLASRVPPIGALLSDAQVVSIESPVPVIIERLNLLRPHLLHSYPTLLELLAHEQRRGALQIVPELITAGSEPLTPSCRALLNEVFPRSRLVETYAATECVPMATSCHLGALHINEDACLLEGVDERGEPVPFGERAERVWVTNLLNTAQPLLRYELNDQAVFRAGQCLCGSPFQVIEVHGRSDDTFYLRDELGAWQAHPPIPLELLFLSVPGLLQYQLVHERQNQLRVLFVTEPGTSGQRVAAHIEIAFSRYLADHGLEHSVGYSLEEVGAIERPRDSRKVRQIVSRVKRPEAEARLGLTVRERKA